METITVRETEVPTFLYGTAWKEDRTEELVNEALEAGFRGIDTANQRKHYHEAGVGVALHRALDSGRVGRDQLFVQTKFTWAAGQDHRLPYDPSADAATQVRQSFDSSLEHLGLDRLDSYILHGPRSRLGLTDADIEAWQTIEELRERGRVGLIGVSNVTPGQLATLCELSEVPPAFVQNRCFARTGWDRETREVCRDRGVTYQGFSLLTANRAELTSPEVRRIADDHGKTVPQVAFRYARQLGMICLTGTTDPVHMRQDLAIGEFELTDDEIETLKRLAATP